jgi:hypothetical protein
MFKIVEDRADRFELEFDNHNQPLIFNPVAATDEFIDLSMGGESAAIAIALSFRHTKNNELNDMLFVFESIAGDKVFPGPHQAGTVLTYDESKFNQGTGLLSGFSKTKLTVTVGPTRQDPFQARLVLSNK